MIDMLRRVIFMIILLAFYILGEHLNGFVDISIEFRFVLPAFSLVFFDSYMNFFSFLKLKVLNKCPEKDDDDKTTKIKTRIKLVAFAGSKSMSVRLKSIQIRQGLFEPTLFHNEKKYNIPEDFECVLSRDRDFECVDIECMFKQPLFCFFISMKVKFIINHDKVKTKRIWFFNYPALRSQLSWSGKLSTG